MNLAGCAYVHFPPFSRAIGMSDGARMQHYRFGTVLERSRGGVHGRDKIMNMDVVPFSAYSFTCIYYEYVYLILT